MEASPSTGRRRTAHYSIVHSAYCGIEPMQMVLCTILHEGLHEYVMDEQSLRRYKGGNQMTCA